MARSPAAIPFAGCGPGVTGWVPLDKVTHELGCMEYDANVIPAEIWCGSRQFLEVCSKPQEVSAVSLDRMFDPTKQSLR